MIPLVKVSMPPRDELMPALEAVLYSGMVAEGEKVYEFERVFAAHFGFPFSLAVSSGTGALHTALALAGIVQGDEVISTPMTAEPTNLAILHAGAMPVWADVSETDGTIDPDSVSALITNRTKAIMVVHYAGYPARMKAIMEIAHKHGIPVIEDCAHALGATYDGHPIGTMGDFSIFSFQAIKHMTTIDGGMLCIKNENLVQSAKKFRWFGMLKGIARTEVDIESVGYKYNMSNVTAAIGIEQLKHIDQIIAKHRSNGRYYDRAFSAIPGVEPARPDLVADPSYWIYTLLCDDSARIEKILAEAGVVASKLHKPNNRHSIFGVGRKHLPGLNRFYDRLLHIPCGWWVDDDLRSMIVETIKKG